MIIQGDCGYTEVPCESRYSALHYHETEHMQTLYYPKEKGREVVYIASPKQCSGGVLMQFWDIVVI